MPLFESSSSVSDSQGSVCMSTSARIGHLVLVHRATTRPVWAQKITTAWASPEDRTTPLHWSSVPILHSNDGAVEMTKLGRGMLEELQERYDVGRYLVESPKETCAVRNVGLCICTIHLCNSWTPFFLLWKRGIGDGVHGFVNLCTFIFNGVRNHRPQSTRWSEMRGGGGQIHALTKCRALHWGSHTFHQK